MIEEFYVSLHLALKFVIQCNKKLTASSRNTKRRGWRWHAPSRSRCETRWRRGDARGTSSEVSRRCKPSRRRPRSEPWRRLHVHPGGRHHVSCRRLLRWRDGKRTRKLALRERRRRPVPDALRRWTAHAHRRLGHRRRTGCAGRGWAERSECPEHGGRRACGDGKGVVFARLGCEGTLGGGAVPLALTVLLERVLDGDGLVH